MISAGTAWWSVPATGSTRTAHHAAARVREHVVDRDDGQERSAIRPRPAQPRARLRGGVLVARAGEAAQLAVVERGVELAGQDPHSTRAHLRMGDAARHAPVAGLIVRTRSRGPGAAPSSVPGRAMARGRTATASTAAAAPAATSAPPFYIVSGAEIPSRPSELAITWPVASQSARRKASSGTPSTRQSR